MWLSLAHAVPVGVTPANSRSYADFSSELVMHSEGYVIRMKIPWRSLAGRRLGQTRLLR